MPLILCPDCSTEVSDQAKACPKCGRPMRKPVPPPHKEPPWLMWVVIFGLIAAMVLWGSIKGRMQGAGRAEITRSAAASQDVAAAKALATIKRESKVIDAQWSQRISFWALVADDGTRRDGYAEYVCEVIRDSGVDGFVAVSIWTGSFGARKVGEARCR